MNHTAIVGKLGISRTTMVKYANMENLSPGLVRRRIRVRRATIWGSVRQGPVKRDGGDVDAVARAPELDDRLGVRLTAVGSVGVVDRTVRDCGILLLEPGQPVLLGAHNRRGRARMTPRRVRRPVHDRDCRPYPVRRRQTGRGAGHGAGPFPPRCCANGCTCTANA